MSKRVGVSGAIGFLVCAIAFGNIYAQSNMPTAPQIRTIALKSGETTELGNVSWVVNCKPISLGAPAVEVLEGPPELTLTIRPGVVVPRAQGCANEVPGGTVVAAAKDVHEKKTARLVFRVKVKTKDGVMKRRRSVLMNFVSLLRPIPWSCFHNGLGCTWKR